MTSTSRAHARLLPAAAVTATLVGAGAFLGFGRDLLLAWLFGAGVHTDAFLVAWTVPETVAPLLIEGAMALVLVPVFSRAIELQGEMRSLVSRTLPAVGGVLMIIAVLVAA